MNLVIVDSSCVYHACLNALTVNDKLRSDYQKHVHFNLMYLLSGAYLHELGYTQEFQIFFAGDQKDYWRHGLLKKHGINYKGNRSRQSWREENLSNVRSYFLSYGKEIGVNVCQMYASKYINGKPYGYEADDLASGVIQTFVDDFDQTFVMTVDTDWLPFTVNKKVTWLNTGNHRPRVRRHVETMQYCMSTNESTKTVARRSFEWKSPTDLWKFKAQFGDTSDNLRGNLKDQKTGFYEPYIDLFNPPEEYKCWKETEFKETVTQFLTKPRKPVPFANIREVNKGSCIVAIPPYETSVMLGGHYSTQTAHW